MSLIDFDIGHMGNTGGREGARHFGLREEDLALDFALHAAELLRSRGHEVQLWTSRRYRARQMAARNARSDAYVAVHVNVDPRYKPDDAYGLVLYRGRPDLARAIEKRLEALDEIPRVALLRATQDDWTRHAYALTEHLGTIPNAVFEPGLLNAPEHAPLWTTEGRRRLGKVLADGLTDFLEAA